MFTKLKDLQSRKSNKGFTIIEVMIVLAIAGLILLIVFLAVPALQRSARNNQRKTDIGRIGAAATTVVSNNNGTVNTTVLTGGAAGTVGTEVGTNLSYYQTSAITVADGTAAVTNNTSISSVIVVANGKCGATTGAATVPANRQIAILYSTENGAGAATPVCIDE